jgi:hypothetical protein
MGRNSVGMRAPSHCEKDMLDDWNGQALISMFSCGGDASGCCFREN